MSRLAYLANVAAAFARAIGYGASRESAAAEASSIEPPRSRPLDPDDDEPDDEIEYLGRGEQYDEETWPQFLANMRQVSSSNVYAYGFVAETRSMGILYVTFLNWTPKDFGGDGSRSGPGATYAYYNFPVMKFRAFQSMAESSAGSAVWDYCRVRHSVFEHQHTYQLVSTSGDYVPRKATAKGFKRRQVAAAGMGRRQAHSRQQLPEQAMAFRKVLPNRGSPNRGSPNRGQPNRG